MFLITSASFATDTANHIATINQRNMVAVNRVSRERISVVMLGSLNPRSSGVFPCFKTMTRGRETLMNQF